MSIVYGRCDTGFDPAVTSHQGNVVTFAGYLKSTTLVGINALRQQLVNLGNIDEPVIPVTWGTDPTFDGWYGVGSVALEPQIGIYYQHFMCAYSITLARVVGYGAPAIEGTVQSVVRTNSLSVSTMAPVVAYTLPATVAGNWTANLTSLTSISRTTSTGQVIAALTKTAAVTTPTTWRTYATPALGLTGGCIVETHDGTNWNVIVGRTLPIATRWRISNGLVRLTSANGATSGSIEVWDGSAWDSINVSHVTNGAVGPGIGLGTGSAQPPVTILYNGPERVTVKCHTADLEMTYTVQRAAMLVTAAWSVGVATKYGAGFTSTVASTAVGAWGLRATANDANGNRVVFGISPQAGAVTVDTTLGLINYATAATTGIMMIGVELAGSGAASGNAAADLGNQFFGAVSWAQQVVPR